MPPRFVPKHEKYIVEKTEEVQENGKRPYVPIPNGHQAYFGPTLIGKTTALKAFIRTFYRGVYDRIIVFNPGVKLEGWEDFGIPQEDLIDDVRLEVIEAKFKEVFDKFDESEYKTSTLMIFDDFGKILRDTAKSKFKPGTRYGIYQDLIYARKRFCSCIFVCQDAKQLPPGVITQLYSVSLAPVFLEPKALERQLAAFPGIEISRRRSTRTDKLTAIEAQQAVIEMNQENDNPYGRLFYYLKYPKYMYQETIVEEHTETVDGQRVSVPRYTTVLTDIVPDIVEEKEDEPLPAEKRRARKEKKVEEDEVASDQE